MRVVLNQSFVLSSAFLILLVFSGCAKKVDPEATTQEGTEASTTSEAEEAAVAELSAEDLALVEEQIYCPVGGKLGGMGTPVKVMVEGKPVFICCEHCREPLLNDPEKYLAELEKKKQESASEEASSEESPAEEQGS